jgi:DUF2075 family protein
MLIGLVLLLVGLILIVANPFLGLVPGLFLIVVGLVVMVLGGLARGVGIVAGIGSTKSCPDCRSKIPSGATVCRSDLAQVDELIRAAKVSVFFIDDLQGVRPNEVGTSDLVAEAALRNDAEIDVFELETQFRCAGSDAFVSWVDNTLGLAETANPVWEGTEGFDFQIVDSVEQLDALIRSKADEGFSARLTAGFRWRWSDPESDGTLVNDVKIGTWEMPWNARPDAGRLAPNVPPSNFWASNPKGINQIGCVYTAQGFEFDYVGVNVGRDLRWDPASSDWIGDPSESQDSIVKRSGKQFTELVKRTYRVLLTRGMKGCFVHFIDGATREVVTSRVGRALSDAL